MPKLKFKDIINKSCKRVAEIAQSVEHFTRNEGVVGSSPIFSLRGRGDKYGGNAVFIAFFAFVPVSAVLHGILQIDVGIVCNLCRAGLTSLVIAFFDDIQLFAKRIIFLVNGVKGN